MPNESYNKLFSFILSFRTTNCLKAKRAHKTRANFSKSLRALLRSVGFWTRLRAQSPDKTKSAGVTPDGVVGLPAKNHGRHSACGGHAVLCARASIFVKSDGNICQSSWRTRFFRQFDKRIEPSRDSGCVGRLFRRAGRRRSFRFLSL